MAEQTRTSRLATWADDRLGLAKVGREHLRKVFPDHWSFMLGEVALWSFVVLLLTGTLLTLWFKPGMAEVTYEGAYDQLRGVHMSEAYASTLHLSFDVRGGLLLRQIHHWAAMTFIAGMMVHLVRVFVTGAFRKPRELNWVIGATMLLLGTIEGFTGYSLPDDLLSGTGVRITEGFLLAIPVVGSYVTFFVFGGEFPGDSIISRLYVVHILLIPGLLLALVTAHLLILVYQKHTQWPGPGRTNDNVAGYPLLPVYAAKSGGFFALVFGTLAVMGGAFTINPVWKYGPYDPAKVTAGSQPDWYMGWPDGALRLMPGIETHAWGHTVAWNVFIPIFVVVPLLFITVLALPFVHRWLTGDREERHLLERPRDAPNRTATIVALATLYTVLLVAGGNDVIALLFRLSIEKVIWTLRVAVFVAPVLAFLATRRLCVSLQRRDNRRLRHGRETGRVWRSTAGRYGEHHGSLDAQALVSATRRGHPGPVDLGPRDLRREPGPSDGVRPAGPPQRRLRRRLVRRMWWFGTKVPDAEEIRRGQQHGPPPHPDVEITQKPADGHQFDGRTPVEEERLR